MCASHQLKLQKIAGIDPEAVFVRWPGRLVELVVGGDVGADAVVRGLSGSAKQHIV